MVFARFFFWGGGAPRPRGFIRS